MKDNRGAAFITVILFTFLLTAIIASVLAWSITERRLTVRNAHWLEARNAAEGVAEYGFSQIQSQFSIHSTPPSLDPAGSNGLTLPATSFWSGAHVDTNPASSDANGLEVIGGTAQVVPSSGNLYYVDPNNTNNQFDPLKGQYVYRRDIQVVAKATVIPPETGAPITAYVTETVSVRGAPLFANAIFYSNSDLEIFPGPTMTITGPVHVNGNMFVSSQGSSLNFVGPVSISGNLYHAWSNSNSASQGTGGETLGQSPVTFVNAVGAQINLDGNGSATGWNDSTMGADNNVSGLSNLVPLVTPATTIAFRQYSTQTFQGNLQTGAMGVQVYNPVSFNEVIDASNDTINPHTIIDPPQAVSSADTYATQKAAVEAEKISNQTGLYIKVNVTPGTTTAAATATLSAYGAPGTAPSGTAANLIGPNLLTPTDSTTGGIKVNLPTAATPLVTFIPFVKQTTTYTSTGGGHYSKVVSYINSSGTAITGTFTANGTSYTPSTTSVSSNPGNSSTVVSGMIDQRRLMDASANDGPVGIDLVQVDMVALRATLNDMIANGAPSANSIKTQAGGIYEGWNGGIYVDVEAGGSQAPTVNTTGANYGYNYSSTQTASVRLVNGEVASGSSLIPPAATSLPTYPGGPANPNGDGLMLATNAPVYILGNFNADGNVTASSPTVPDDGGTGATGSPSSESPTCVAGDAITILSNGWSDANSGSVSPGAAAGTNAGSATAGNKAVEVATAMMAGAVSTDNATSSGGAHNLPRFLENFGGVTVAIRGSLTCLYLSGAAVQPWSTAYYSPPNRQWGFDDLFSNGNYPPLTPKVLSFRRVNYTDMSAAQYAAAKHVLYPSEF